jgi:phospho-N-acetylmuramoyl-pentapeptide-transferase
MLFNFLVPLADEHIIFNVFRYLTFRSGGAVITSLLISFALGPGVIAWLKSKQREGQPIRDDGPESHLLTKQGTPTMGGVLILMAIAISTLLWADLTNGFVWAILFVTIGFGLIGFGDDYLKLTRRSSKGLPSRFKFLAQIAIGTAATLWIVHISPEQLQTHLAIPLLKGVLLNLGWFFVAFAVFVMVGASNAVNLTDGLDGLAIVPVMIAAGCFALIAWLVGNTVFAGYLQVHYVAGTGELAVFCSALVGASLGFLPAGHGLHG